MTTEISITSVPHFCRKYTRVWFAAPFFPLVGLLVKSWPYRVAPAVGESCGAHICPIPCWLCHLMYTHTLMVLQQMSHHSQHQSNARTSIIVPSGPFGLAEQELLFQHSTFSSSLKNDGQGGNAYNLLDCDNQSAAIICVDSIKRYNSCR